MRRMFTEERSVQRDEGVIQNFEVECLTDDPDHIHMRFEYEGERYLIRLGREHATDVVQNLAEWLREVNRHMGDA